MTVAIKGTAQGLIVTLGDGAWDEILSRLNERLSASSGFFRGAEATLRLEDGALNAERLALVKNLFQEYGGTLRAVQSDDSETRAAARALGLSASASPRRVARPAREASDDSGNGLVVHRTVRSGQIIRHSGSIVVIGDVNPGAEIVAGGDIVVWGRLRGLVHAGASGEQDAMVGALLLAPTQLRIADLIARPPDVSERRRGRVTPEVARISDGMIVVEAWDPH